MDISFEDEVFVVLVAVVEFVGAALVAVVEEGIVVAAVAEGIVGLTITSVFRQWGNRACDGSVSTSC